MTSFESSRKSIFLLAATITLPLLLAYWIPDRQSLLSKSMRRIDKMKNKTSNLVKTKFGFEVADLLRKILPGTRGASGRLFDSRPQLKLYKL
uniref:Uncharacterized protein n=1 Tax=Romanomermis culicivorax TaxID=13658 RepID=A0A915JQJ8_ROMCU